VAGEWVLWTLTAECADMVSDPSEESLLSNAPGVNRKEVREGVRDGGWYSRVLRICFVPESDPEHVLDGDGLGSLGCRRFVRWRRIGARTNGC
jgi:hypothetical protein